MSDTTSSFDSDFFQIKAVEMGIFNKAREKQLQKDETNYQKSLTEPYQTMDLSWYKLLRLLSRKTTAASNGELIQ